MRTRRAAAAAALAAALGQLLGAAAAGARDRGADGEFDTRTSAHFALLQDVDIDETGGFHGSRRFEQGVLAVLEGAYEGLDRRLGLRPPRRIRVVIYDPDVFERRFAGLFRFSAAGFYAGVIRIRGSTRVDDALVGVLHHELVHAALDMAAPSYAFPAWLNEGLAQWFEARTAGKRRLAGVERAALRRAGGGLFGLARLSTPSFSHLGPQRAGLAYLESYAFVSYLAERHGDETLARLVRRLVDTRDLERSLRRIYRADLATLEARFRSGLR